jgi:isocitrate dehydrogenase kinase/phosphatase
MEIGEINVPETIVQLEHRVGKLEELLDRILNGEDLDQETIEKIDKKVLKDLQEKYPDSGIEKKQN